MVIYCDGKQSEQETCCDIPGGPVSASDSQTHTHTHLYSHLVMSSRRICKHITWIIRQKHMLSNSTSTIKVFVFSPWWRWWWRGIFIVQCPEFHTHNLEPLCNPFRLRFLSLSFFHNTFGLFPFPRSLSLLTQCEQSLATEAPPVPLPTPKPTSAEQKKPAVVNCSCPAGERVRLPGQRSRWWTPMFNTQKNWILALWCCTATKLIYSTWERKD